MDLTKYLKGSTELSEAMYSLASTCAHISKLKIRWGHAIDLNEIASSFPFLETLISCKSDATFKQLNRLQTLHMDAWAFQEPPTALEPWLPLQSTQTLTELSLTCFYPRHISYFDIPSSKHSQTLNSSPSVLSTPLSSTTSNAPPYI